MFAPSSPQAYNGPNPQDASMLDGPGAPTGSVTSMGRSMDRSTLTALREATADRLASTVQVRLTACSPALSKVQFSILPACSVVGSMYECA